jgi:anti-sigma regulatory factor (Ser/Thr protein kinase)
MVRNPVANTADVARIRREFRHWLEQHFCLDRAQRDDLVLAGSEALTNAAEHGHSGRGAGIVVLVATYGRPHRV